MIPFKEQYQAVQRAITAADRAAVLRMANAAKGLRSSEIIALVYKNADMQKILATGGDLARPKVAYLSGLVLAEVSIARLSA